MYSVERNIHEYGCKDAIVDRWSVQEKKSKKEAKQSGSRQSQAKHEGFTQWQDQIREKVIHTMVFQPRKLINHPFLQEMNERKQHQHGIRRLPFASTLASWLTILVKWCSSSKYTKESFLDVTATSLASPSISHQQHFPTQQGTCGTWMMQATNLGVI